MEVVHERKMTKYDPLQMEIERKGWRSFKIFIIHRTTVLTTGVQCTVY